MLEKEIEAKACEWAKQQGWLVYKFVSPQKRGVPDRIFFRNGVTQLIEFKTPTGRLTRLQELQIAKLRSEGIAVAVCDSVDKVKSTLGEYDEDHEKLPPVSGRRP